MNCQSSTPHLPLAGQPWVFRVWLHALWAVQCTSHFPAVNAELPWEAESNILHHLLDNIIIFLQTSKEHLHHLCVIFEWFREHNLKLKLSKCNFFRNKITYLAHQVLKDGVCPSDLNLKAIVECAPPQMYMEMHAFLNLVGHYRRFIKGFAHVAQPLSKYFAGEGDSRKSEQVSLTKEAMEAFEVLKWVCMTAPVLVFTDYTKPFLLETDASKDGLGVMLSQKQADGQYHTIAYGSQALTSHEKNYHSTKLEFWAVKWAVTTF